MKYTIIIIVIVIFLLYENNIKERYSYTGYGVPMKKERLMREYNLEGFADDSPSEFDRFNWERWGKRDSKKGWFDKKMEPGLYKYNKSFPD